ncbi:DMT family transporter [Parvibium lacunae]|uniref:DMT family transporter n=1 Tax=Parvibium lacunae TaxID=1888893 RepID=A0A368L691_9BURK|nr:DMT family transporter [Parvibium lacunae]RCS59208.1 DMT family transporter [Parvibium lacunae]
MQTAPSPVTPSEVSQAAIMRRRYRLGLLAALLGAVLFSAKAIIVKLSYRYNVDAETQLAMRMGLALPFFGLLLLWDSYRQRVKGAQLQTAKPYPKGWRAIGQLVIVGLLGYYAASYLDFLGLQHISAALERLILFLYPTLVLLFSRWWFAKPIRREQWWALLISYAGIGFVFIHDVQLGGATVVLGAMLVFASAICYALYLVFCGELVSRYGSLRLTVMATTVAALACLIQFFLLRGAAGWMTVLAYPWPVYGLALVNAFFCTVLPVNLTMLAIAYCGAGVTSQTGMVGPLATIVLGALLLGEPISVWQLVGAAVVLLGIYLLSRYRFQ